MSLSRGNAELRSWSERATSVVGKLTGPGTFTVISGEPRHGDIVQMSVQLDAEGRVSDARFKAFGSVLINGCAAFLCDWAKGKTLAELGDCVALDLGGLFEFHPVYQREAAAPVEAMLALVKKARLELGEMSAGEAESEAAVQLTVTPELFDEAAFAEQIEHVMEKFAKGPSPDGARVALRVAAAVMGHESPKWNPEQLDPTTRTAAEILADIRYLDGGLAQDVAGRVIAVFASRTSKGGA